MARLFNVEIFNSAINSGATYFSSPDFNELLGRADFLVLQVIVDSAPSTATITAQYQSSNDNGSNANFWVNNINLAPAVSATTANCPGVDMKRSTSSDALGAFGRVSVSASAGAGFAVRVIACGHTEG